MDESKQINELQASVSTNLAKNLMLARITTGLTQQALADAAGVSRATINQIESGEADPRLSTLVDIASALGVNPLMFFIGESEMLSFIEMIEKSNKNEFIVNINDVHNMNKLLQSGLQKNLVRAAAIGAEAVAGLEPQGSKATTKSDDRSSSNYNDAFKKMSPAIGAAIGSAILPGAGTILGFIMGLSMKFTNDDESK